MTVPHIDASLGLVSLLNVRFVFGAGFSELSDIPDGAFAWLCSPPREDSCIKPVSLSNRGVERFKDGCIMLIIHHDAVVRY